MSGDDSRMRALLLSFCVSFTMALPAAAGEREKYELGALAVWYDRGHWSFEQVEAGDPLRAQPKIVRATCTGCRKHAFVTISIADVAREESESVLDPVWGRDRRRSTLKVGELTVGVTAIHSRCRNYVPPSHEARVTYRGRSHSFRSGIIAGCHGSGGVDRERFEELLRGLHPRE
jgi:hypothetical protein